MTFCYWMAAFSQKPKQFFLSGLRFFFLSSQSNLMYKILQQMVGFCEWRDSLAWTVSKNSTKLDNGQKIENWIEYKN